MAPKADDIKKKKAASSSSATDKPKSDSKSSNADTKHQAAAAAPSSSAAASASASGSGGAPAITAPVKPVAEPTLATNGVKPATIATSVSVAANLSQALSEIVEKRAASEKAAKKAENEAVKALTTGSAVHPSESLYARPTFIFNIKCDKYDPLSDEKNTLNCEYHEIKKNIAYHLKLFFKKAHNDPFGKKFNRRGPNYDPKMELCADVLFPHGCYRFAYMEPRGNYDPALEGKVDERGKTGDAGKASTLLLFDGHPFDERFIDPNDPGKRDKFFVKLIKKLTEIWEWAIAYIYMDSKMPDGELRKGIKDAVEKVSKGDDAKEMLALLVKKRKTAAAAAHAKRDAHLKTPDGAKTMPPELSLDVLTRQHPLGLTDAQWEHRIKIDAAIDYARNRKFPPIECAKDEKKQSIEHSEGVFMSSTLAATNTEKAKKAAQNKREQAEKVGQKRKTQEYVPLPKGKGKGKGKGKKSVTVGAAKEAFDPVAPFVPEFGSDGKQTVRSQFLEKVHKAGKILIPLSWKRIIVEQDEETGNKAFKEVAMSNVEVEREITANSVVQPAVRLEFKLDHSACPFRWSLQPREGAYCFEATNKRPETSARQYFTGTADANDERYGQYKKRDEAEEADSKSGSSSSASAMDTTSSTATASAAAPAPVSEKAAEEEAKAAEQAQEKEETKGEPDEDMNDGSQADSPASKRMKLEKQAKASSESQSEPASTVTL